MLNLYQRIIKLQNATEQCLPLVVTYLQRDLSKVNSGVKFSVEVFGADVLFQIIDLAFYLQKFLATKSHGEFDVDDGVKLYVIAKLGSEGVEDPFSCEENDGSDENEEDEESAEDGNSMNSNANQHDISDENGES